MTKISTKDWVNLPFDKYELIYRLYLIGRFSYKDGEVYRHFDGVKEEWLEQPVKIGAKKPDGYISHSMKYRGNQYQFMVHRMVYVFFNGPESLSAGRVINHLDGDKGNNRIENLELVTQSDNIRHSLRTGLKRIVNNNTTKLTWDEVDLIRMLYNEGEYSQRDLAKMYGVSQSNIGQIVSYKTWKEEYREENFN